MREEVAVFGAGDGLVGITTDPQQDAVAATLPAVVIPNAGIIHRVGPNRIHVKLARHLAAMGFPVLRFDFSGIGDSETHQGMRDSSDDRVISEMQEAMDHLSRQRGVNRFILLGICSGASISFKTACRDPRVVGLVLINASGYLHGPDAALGERLRQQAMARHYWRLASASSFRAKNWLKAFTGRMNYHRLWRALKAFPRQDSVRWDPSTGVLPDTSSLKQLARRGVRMFIIHSEADEGLDYLHLVLGGKLAEWRQPGPIKLEIIEGANHVFTLLWSQDRLADLIRDWVHHWIRA